eukprot:988304-Prorocentrum_minimum.AAC.1
MVSPAWFRRRPAACSGPATQPPSPCCAPPSPSPVVAEGPIRRRKRRYILTADQSGTLPREGRGRDRNKQRPVKSSSH